MTARTVASGPDRQQVIARYQQVRDFSETLCGPLTTEDYVIQSMPDCSPTKWHLGHVSWFFETFLLKPSVPDYRYRGYVDEHVLDLLECSEEGDLARIAPIVTLGLHYEQQHQELMLTDLKHMLSRNPLFPVYIDRAPNPVVDVPPLQWQEFPEGVYWIGHEGEDFAFDNEEPRHREFVSWFRLASRLVTNGEYLHFMEDGGYQRPEFWLSMGWATGQQQGWRGPLYWQQRDGGYWDFTLSGLRPVDPAEPVSHISYFEADAYARWAGARLPTEAEWEVASTGVAFEGNFVEAGRYHPTPPQVRHSEASLAQMFGDVWEWTQSSYSPYRVSASRPALSASTTANSCATSMFCAAARAPPRSRTSGRLIETSSRPRRAGNSRVCDWRWMHEQLFAKRPQTS